VIKIIQLIILRIVSSDRNVMGIKPIPLSAFMNSFVPPVTGVGGSLAPVANSYDDTGNFQGRGRSGSVKRKRTDEIDTVYDLSQPYPPLNGPAKPKLDLSVIKDLVVAAGVAGGEVRAILEDPNVDEKMRAFGNLNLAVLAVVEAMLESGFVPLTGATAAAADAAKRAPSAPTPPAKPTPVPGLKELREGLEKADKECVLFGANLGSVTMANRNALANALSGGIRAAVVAKAESKGLDSAEMIRDLDDALSCVNDMEFIGGKSQKYIKEGDPKSNTFCTMPVKFRFDDRNARINFEKTLRSSSDLKAFKTALQPRYPDDVIAIRLDTFRSVLFAVKKKDGEKDWTKCEETLSLPPGILLQSYVPRKSITLPAQVVIATDTGSDASTQVTVMDS
jgi:hypothetical protein